MHVPKQSLLRIHTDPNSWQEHVVWADQPAVTDSLHLHSPRLAEGADVAQVLS